MNAQMLSALEQVQIDPKSPANINYVKARVVIEEAAKSRGDRREAKMAVVALLKGEVTHHPIPSKAGQQPTVKKEVAFPDGTKARF